jgi:hypothetical protein
MRRQRLVCRGYAILSFSSFRLINYLQTLWLLANDKESQDKLRAEVGPLFAENPHPDYRSLKDLQWLDCVVFVFDTS